jgi:type II secretory pathway component GspD/PulD (secretin)
MNWLGVVAGLALPAAGVGMAEGLAAGRGADVLVCQNVPRSRASAALNDAIDSYKKGDYEAAAEGFRQARAGAAGLSPDQQQDLTRFAQANAAALQRRREAADLVRQAEQAQREGRGGAAADLAQKALANQYVAAADRQKAQEIVGRARGTPDGAADNPVVAKGKLAQARRLLAEGNFDAAEQLAREAERAGAGPGEESPKKLLEEIGRARQDPAALLTAARAALAHGDLDRAEQLAKASEKAEPVYAVHLWGDSPSKVLKEVQAARAPKKPTADKDKDGASVVDSMKGLFTSKKSDGAAPPADAPKPAKGADAAKPGPGADEARRLVQQGRKALRDGQIDKAEDCAHKADALKANLGWWEEDNPAKLLADVQAAKAERGAHKKDSDAKAPPADPKALLKQAHEAFSAGKLDEATALAQKAKTAPGASWGLFDFDTPDKLMNEVNKARAKRDQEEAAKLVAEGRKLLEQGDLDAAQKAALRAQTLHGPYGVMEWGDRPTKLLDDIDAARKKGRAKVVPPVPPVGGAMAGNDGAGRWPAGQDDPRVKQARQMMSDARAAARAGNSTRALAIVESVEAMNLPADKLGSDSPAAVRRELSAVAQGNPPPTPPAFGGNDQARALVAEARQLQAQGRLLDARSRLLEAQKLPAAFGPQDDRPEKALLDLAGLARRQIDRLETQADETVHHGTGDPREYARAEDNLAQAQALARGFQLDTYLLDKKLDWVKQARGNAVAQGNPNDIQRVTVTDHGPQGQGQQLLAQARMEIRAGKLDAARRLADQVYAGPYGLKTDAENMLRSIDAEEWTQKRSEARRTFEAGNSAFRRGDYQIASRLLRTIDVKMLDDKQQARMRELMSVPEMQPANFPEAVAQGGPPAAGAVERPDGAAGAHVGDDSREATFLKQVEAMREVKFQKMRDEQFKTEKEARKLADAGDTEHALEVLQEYLGQLPESGLDPDKTALLRRPVEAKLQQYRTLDAQKKFKDAEKMGRQQKWQNHKDKELTQLNKEQKIKELMDKYNKLFKEAKYGEAEMYALQAQELDPDNATAAAAVTIAKMQGRLVRYQAIRDGKEKMFLELGNDAENEGPPINLREPLHIDKGRWADAQKRKPFDLKQIGGLKSEKEREIERRLLSPVNMNFSNVPLGKVIDDLATIHEINILPDVKALNEAGVSLDHTLTFRAENMSLKSALKHLLDQVNLTYTIEDEALNITTKENARGKLVTVPYQVTELIVPIADGNAPAPLPPMIDRRLNNQTQPPLPSSPTPVTGALSLTGGTPTGSAGGSTFGTSGGSSGGQWSKGAAQTREDQLIQLIQNTVQPRSWAQMGGQGTIDYFPMTMTLVINQTPDIQEQIADLLQALRRLQDAEVAIEVRLISIAEGFFERIGVDFNVNIVNEHGTQKFQPMITSGQFQPAGFLNDFNPNRFLAGLTPGGTFTSDLGIPIRQSSFGMAIPPFGGFPNAPGANGGISLGLAFLSDIQVFMFMEAAQGDQRTNVMQAPKLTLFNGQTSTLTASDEQFFSTGASVQISNGQPVFIPNNVSFPTGGVFISLQAVISADRRFVRLNFTGLTLTNLASAVVPLMPVTIPVPQILDGVGTVNTTVFTQFIQQPTFNTITVTTTVAVPDGGTVLLGGLKRLSEGRNEFGPPVLSKIPYLSRLFRNVGYGREVQNFMMMVTPRIIINEEEEKRQTGLEFGPAAEGR